MSHGHLYLTTPDPLYISTEEEAEYWCDRYVKQPAIAYDTETTGLHKIKSRIKFFSFSDGNSRICGPVRLLDCFRPVLENPYIEKRFANAKYDMHLTANHGIYIWGRTADTVHMDWHYDENREGRHGLKETSLDHLGLRMAPFKEVFGSVGSTDKEVQTLCRIHDILEAGDRDAAADMLVELRKADGDEEVLQALQKLTLSKRGNYVLDAKQLTALGRKNGLAPRGSGVKSYVSDFFEMLGGAPIPTKQRADAEVVLRANYFDLIVEAHEHLLVELRKMIRLDTDPLDLLTLIVADYASLDAWATFVLRDLLTEYLMADDEGGGFSVLDRYEDQGVPYTRTLWNMERRGFKMDLPLLETYAQPMKKDLDAIEREVVRLAGWNVNLSSPMQLRQLFFSKDPVSGKWVDPFGDEPMRWTKGGATGVKEPSTDKKTLEMWSERGNKLAEKILEFREFEKLYGTYFESLPEWVDRHGRIHTNLDQKPRTGRLSSNDPNLQNIPAKRDWGKKIRKLFIPGLWGDCLAEWCMENLLDAPVPDLDPETPMTLIVADYSQLELRLTAHVSQDDLMVEAINKKMDLHCLTSAKVAAMQGRNIPYEEYMAAKDADENKCATPAQLALVEERSGNKAVAFGIIYGIGAVKLGVQLGLPIVRKLDKHGRMREYCPEGQKLIDGYLDTYPGVRDAIESCRESCREHLYVQTITGRKRRLPDILSTDRGLASQAERQAFNSIIQGSAADIAEAVMIKCEEDLELRALGVRLLLQIHDELVFEVPDIPEYVEPAKARIRYLMEHPFSENLSVPLTVSLHEGKSWGAAK